MNRRLPAILAALITAILGIGLLAATGQLRPRTVQLSLADLEKRIVGSNDAALWCAYAEKLGEAGRHEDAAKAFEKAIAIQPDLAEARLKAGVALGQAGNADKFFEYVTWLSTMYPRQAVDLLERPEVTAMRTDRRFEPAAAAAHAQAVD